MKIYNKPLLTAALLICILLSCKKAGSAEAPKMAPTNLVVNSSVATDGSGLVAFNATAGNAISYTYDFGNGETQTVSSGSVNYTYALTGTNRFTVTVTAKSSAGLTLQKSLPVTVMVNEHVPALFGPKNLIPMARQTLPIGGTTWAPVAGAIMNWNIIPGAPKMQPCRAVY